MSKSYEFPNLYQATGKLTTAHYRIQKTAWLKEGEAADTTDVVSRYNKRISDITGLSTETAELLQLGNYGIGGWKSPHFTHSGARNKSDVDVTITVSGTI